MISIRPATAEDVSQIATLHVAGWQAAYGGAVDQAWLDTVTVEKRVADWTGWLAAGDSTSFIADQDGVAAGFITSGRTRTPPPGSSPIRPSHAAEIYALYLHPDYWRQGTGTALLRHAAGDLKTRRQSSLCLWVLDSNERAKSFYIARGAQKLGTRMVEIGPSKVKEACYGWRDTAELIGNT